MIETVDGDVLIKYENYHILSMQVFCVIEDNKHKIKTIVDYVKNQKHYRKVYENVLEEQE